MVVVVVVVVAVRPCKSGLFVIATRQFSDPVRVVILYEMAVDLSLINLYFNAISDTLTCG